MIKKIGLYISIIICCILCAYLINIKESTPNLNSIPTLQPSKTIIGKKTDSSTVATNHGDILTFPTINSLFEIGQKQLDQLIKSNKKEVLVLGYYKKGDTPFPISYSWIESKKTKHNNGNIIVPKESKNGAFIHTFKDTLNIAYFGIFPGDKDITKKLNHVAEYASNNKLILKFNNGTYFIDAALKHHNASTPNNLNKKGFIIPSNSILETSSNTIFQAIPNKDSNYSIITFHYVNNVQINQLRIIGEKNHHSGTSGEWGHGIFILGSKNITIENINVTNCWGDGIIFSGDGEYSGGRAGSMNENIKINTIYSAHNRRQGITISNGKNIYLNSVEINNIKGILPESGIDFEPDYPYDQISNIVINNLKTYESAGRGIVFSLHALNKQSSPITINIGKWVSLNETALFVGGAHKDYIKGEIKINNLTSKNAPIAALEVRSYFNQPNLIINNLQIQNPNSTNRKDFYGSAILIHKDVDDLVNTTNMISPLIQFGNIEISDNRVSPQLQYGLLIDNKANPAEKLRNIKINYIKVKGQKESKIYNFGPVNSSKINQ